MANIGERIPLYHGHCKVFVSDFLCINKVYEQFKFPKSKKLRIRRKWAKNKANFKWVTQHKAIKIGDAIYVSSDTYSKMLLRALPANQS